MQVLFLQLLGLSTLYVGAHRFKEVETFHSLISSHCKVNTFFQLFKKCFHINMLGLRKHLWCAANVSINQPWGWGKGFLGNGVFCLPATSPFFFQKAYFPLSTCVHDVSQKSQQSAISQGVRTCPVLENDMQICSCLMWEAGMNKTLSRHFWPWRKQYLLAVIKTYPRGRQQPGPLTLQDCLTLFHVPQLSSYLPT